MKREVAERIIAAMKQMESAHGELDLAVRVVEDEATRRQMLRAMADTIHSLHLNVTVPVVRHHPDLHPDGHSRTY